MNSERCRLLISIRVLSLVVFFGRSLAAQPWIDFLKQPILPEDDRRELIARLARGQSAPNARPPQRGRAFFASVGLDRGPALAFWRAAKGVAGASLR